MITITFGVEQLVTYKNWEGHTARRRILPLRLEKKELVVWKEKVGDGGRIETERVLPHGPGNNWCLEVIDLDLMAKGKPALRSFLVDNILADHPNPH